VGRVAPDIKMSGPTKIMPRMIGTVNVAMKPEPVMIDGKTKGKSAIGSRLSESGNPAR
jgi:hypothetical protein